MATAILAPAIPAIACSTSLVCANSFDSPEPGAFCLPSTLRMPTFCTFSRRMSSLPLGMTVSFWVASSRPRRPAFSLARLVCPSFSLDFSAAFSAASRFCFCCFSKSSACGVSGLATRLVSSASGGRGTSLSQIRFSSSANRPTTAAVPTVI